MKPFIELDATNVQQYLHNTGHLQPDETAAAELLAWGVSNVVLRVATSTGKEFVLKQSREQLRTEVLWKSRLDRIYRECEVMQTVAELLPDGAVPLVLFEDRKNYLFAMQAVDANHIVWKADLLSGVVDCNIAKIAGDILAAIHSRTAGKQEYQALWSDSEVFVQLRVDPFYRYVAKVHPLLKDAIDEMISEMWLHTLCVTHADFSPKNILISKAGVSLVDFETAHYGDPAFDIGFFLSHLLLKTVLHAERAEEYLQLCSEFWNYYVAGLGTLISKAEWKLSHLEERGVKHLAACMLSRIDGTSTVDYLTKLDQQEYVRDYCSSLLLQPVKSINAAFELLKSRIV